MRRYLLKNNQGKLKTLSEADLIQLIIRGVIKYDTRLLNEETDLWSKAGSLPFFQKLIEKTHQKEVSALKDQISNVSIQFEKKFEKLNQKHSAINDEKEHYQFLTNQKKIQNKELMQEIQTLSLISANSLKSEAFEKIKVDYKENINELDELRTENRILNKKIKTSEMKAHELVIQVESLQNKYDKIPKNNFEHEYLQLLSENKKIKIENAKLKSNINENESLVKKLILGTQTAKEETLVKDSQAQFLALEKAKQEELKDREIKEKEITQSTKEELLFDSSLELDETTEDAVMLSLDDDLLIDISEEDVKLEELEIEENIEESIRTPELRTLDLEDDDLLGDDICLNEDLEDEANDSQEGLLELSNEPIWQVKGIDALSETYTLLEMKEFREQGKIKEATFIKKIGEWWKRYTDHYELLIPVTPMKLGNITKIYLKKESLRVSMNELIRTYIGDVFSHGEILNISIGGCQIKMNKSLEHLFTNDRELRIDFNEGSLLSGIKIKGIVRRVEPEGQQFICGIQFIELESREQKAVEELIASNSSHLNLTAA